MKIYLVNDVDAVLNIVPLETIDDTNRLHVQDYCLNVGCEFLLGNCTANQTLPSLDMEVENDG